MCRCTGVWFPNTEIRGMKGKGSSLGGTQSFFLQLQQVRPQEGGTRQDNVLLVFSWCVTRHSPLRPGAASFTATAKTPRRGGAESHPAPAELWTNVLWGICFALKPTETGGFAFAV